MHLHFNPSKTSSFQHWLHREMISHIKSPNFPTPKEMVTNPLNNKNKTLAIGFLIIHAKPTTLHWFNHTQKGYQYRKFKWRVIMVCKDREYPCAKLWKMGKKKEMDLNWVRIWNEKKQRRESPEAIEELWSRSANTSLWWRSWTIIWASMAAVPPFLFLCCCCFGEWCYRIEHQVYISSEEEQTRLIPPPPSPALQTCLWSYAFWITPVNNLR